MADRHSPMCSCPDQATEGVAHQGNPFCLSVCQTGARPGRDQGETRANKIWAKSGQNLARVLSRFCRDFGHPPPPPSPPRGRTRFRYIHSTFRGGIQTAVGRFGRFDLGLVQFDLGLFLVGLADLGRLDASCKLLILLEGVCGIPQITNTTPPAYLDNVLNSCIICGCGSAPGIIQSVVCVVGGI